MVITTNGDGRNEGHHHNDDDGGPLLVCVMSQTSGLTHCMACLMVVMTLMAALY